MAKNRQSTKKGSSPVSPVVWKWHNSLPMKSTLFHLNQKVLAVSPFTRSRARHMRPIQNIQNDLAEEPPTVRSYSPRCKLVARKPYSRFHTLPTELIDAIYENVSGGNAMRARRSSSAGPLAIHRDIYDSLVAFDIYLWEVQAPCTLRSTHPRDFLRDFHRQGRRLSLDLFPVFHKIPHSSNRVIEVYSLHERVYVERTFFKKLHRIIRLQPLFPYIFKQFDLPPDLDAEIAPNSDVQFGSEFYDYVLSLSDRRNILAIWRLALELLPDELDTRVHSHVELYTIWHNFLYEQSITTFVFS